MPENFFRWMQRNREEERRRRDGLPADAPPAASPRRVRRRHAVYALVRTLYVGQTGRPVHERIAEHRRGEGHTERQREHLGDNRWHVRVLERGLTAGEAARRERHFIEMYDPPANTQGRE